MNEGRPPTDGERAPIEDVQSRAQQALREIGLVPNPALDLSFLHRQPDPASGPRPEMHRGGQRRLSVLTVPEAEPAPPPMAPPSGPVAGPVPQPMEALTPPMPMPPMPMRQDGLAAPGPPSTQQMMAQLLFRCAGGVATAIAPMLSTPEQAGRLQDVLMQLMPMGEQTSGLMSAIRAILGLLSPNVYQATLNEPNQKTAEVSTNELLQILEQQRAVVFDSRTRLEYAIGHIPGALSVAPKPGIPMSQYVSDVAEIARTVPDKSAAMILYCNGPFCGKSKRLADELVNAGYTNVRRYQLGTPIWRALVGPMVIELEGIRYVLEGDRTAVFLDARRPEEFAAGSLPVARNVPLSEVDQAKDDDRLPMDDFNTRVIAFGQDGAQARALAEALVKNGFNNVKYYAGTFSTLLMIARRS
jgi:rhodanese-related sulfurtransferase